MSRDLEEELVFAHEYELSWLEDWPVTGSDVRYYYPGASQAGGKDGLCLRIKPRGSSAWVGVFGFGDPSDQMISGVWSHPDPFTVCVVSRGKAYLVNVREPQQWVETVSFPVTAVVAAPSERLLLFVDFTEIAAYGEGGLVWRTRQLSWDGIQVTTIERGLLTGLAHDPTLPTPVEFIVELRTGAATGGSSPDLYIK